MTLTASISFDALFDSFFTSAVDACVCRPVTCMIHFGCFGCFVSFIYFVCFVVLFCFGCFDCFGCFGVEAEDSEPDVVGCVEVGTVEMFELTECW